MSANSYPAFKVLPLDKSHPEHSAWFVWGKEDELGTINHLTPEVVKAAAQEISLGTRVSLNLALDLPKFPYLNRCAYEQKIINKAPRIINDDVITFNTQQGSQWDSFRHFAYQKEARFYNDVPLDMIVGEKAGTRNGIQALADAGIAGRGVLLDFYAYAKEKGLEYEPWSQYGITLEQLEEVRAWHGIEYKAGDIILIRTGHIARYYDHDDEARKIAATVPHRWAGVKQDKGVLEWIWDNKFAAVGGDSPAWEVTPHMASFNLHPFILSGLGCPIGELFDLEELSKVCAKLGRYTFFLTSAPLNIPGGVASPPNALALF